MNNKIETVFSSSLKKNINDFEELDNCLGILGERTVVHFMDVVPTVLDNPESTPLRVEIEYWPKLHPGDPVGPSIVYTVMGRGRRVTYRMTQEELEKLRDDMSPLE